MLRFNKRCGFSRSSYCLAMVFVVVVFSAAWISTLSMYILRYSPRRRSADFSVFGRLCDIDLMRRIRCIYTLTELVVLECQANSQGVLLVLFIAAIWTTLFTSFRLKCVRFIGFCIQTQIEFQLHINIKLFLVDLRSFTMQTIFFVVFKENFHIFQFHFSYLSILFFIYFFSIFFILLNSTWS